MLLPKDGMPGDDGDEDEDDAGEGDGVVVAGADTELGQLIILQLVLARYEAECVRCLLMPTASVGKLC